jgi:hypothetical protein
MARYDDLNTNMIAYGTLLSIIVLILALQGTQALNYSMVNYEDARKEASVKSRASVSTKEKSEQLQSLNGYKKVLSADDANPDVTKETLQIPIESAKALVLKELAGAGK